MTRYLRYALPRHPRTGLPALGIRKDGRPIFAILGADENGDTALADDPRLAGLSEKDRAAFASLIAREQSLLVDASRASDEIEAITGQYGTDRDKMPAGQSQRLDNMQRRARGLAAELEDVNEDILRRARTYSAARRSERTGRGLEHIGNGPDVHLRRHGDPWSGLEQGVTDTPTGLRSRATDMAEYVADVPQEGRKAFADAVAGDQDRQALLARWALATGRDSYRSAFAKVLANPQRGHMLWTEAERAAFADVDVISRAMGEGSNGAGGFMVPFFLDPTVMLTNAGTISAIRRLARTEMISTNAWHGVSSAGVTAEWLAEASEAADASPTLAQPSVPVHKMDAFVPYSFELEADQPLLGGELQKLLADAADVLTATAFATGDGTGKPRGVTVGISSGSKVAVGTADTLVTDDVYALQNALGARFQLRAAFVAALPTINRIAALETANGALQFPEVRDGQLLRRELAEDSNLPSVGATSGAGNDAVAIYGSLSDGYLIAQQVGTRLEYIQNLFGANGRPTGQRGLMLWARVGGDVINTNALRVLTA